MTPATVLAHLLPSAVLMCYVTPSATECQEPGGRES